MNEWIEWKGGECPVGLNDSVDLQFKDGFVISTCRAGSWSWASAQYGPGSIVAYRLTKPLSREEAYDETTRGIRDSEYETAPVFLKAAAKHMEDRAATYDKPEGERSITQVVAIFNQFHGTNLTEAQGWHFMEIVKQVRFFTKEGFHRDSAEDSIAYAALRAEAKQREGV